MIVVTGATGQLGRGIVEALLGRVGPARVGASVRDPAKAADLAARGVRVRRGDFTDPAALRDAFAGATQVLIVSSDAERTGGDAVAQHRVAIAAAKVAGARRVLYTSHMAVAAGDSKFAPIRTHAATEALLRESGVPFTALRHGFYADSALMMLGDVAAARAVVAPADGPVSWTARADLAAADAAILADEGRFDGPTPALTAGEALDLSDLAALLGDLLGGPVERRVVPDDAYFGQAVAHGMPEAVAGLMRGLYEAARAGQFAAVDPALARLLGRPPTPMRAVLAARFGAPAR